MLKPSVLALALLSSALLVGPAAPVAGSDRPLSQPQAVVAAKATPDFDEDGKADLAFIANHFPMVRDLRVRYGTGRTAVFTPPAGDRLRRR